MPRPKQRTPELGERVLEAALRLLAREGVEALTARRVAAEAATSPAAVYELFGDKAGVVRAMFFSGFRQLGAVLAEVPVGTPQDAVGELAELAAAYRGFLVAHPGLATVMFSRPFAAFDPAPEESAAGAAVRERFVGTVRRGVDAGVLRGDPTDIAHAVVALVHGLAAAENASRLGRSRAAVGRRWEVAVDALLAGFG